MEKKKQDLILVKTDALLEATGWTIEELMEVFGLTKAKSEELIKKITKQKD